MHPEHYNEAGEGEIDRKELELLEQLFKEDLPESPIDLDYYFGLADNDEDIQSTLSDVLNSSLKYTEDIANLEKIILEDPSSYDVEREALDQVRTRAHNAVIDNINIFARTLRSKGLEVKWLKWSTEERVAYKKFAVSLTLNRFKNDILDYRKKINEDVLEKVKNHEIDIDELKLKAKQNQLIIIEYVEILIKIDKNKEQQGDDDASLLYKKLNEIELKLHKKGEEILSAFYRISMKR
jgi:hypothetical protein